MAKILIPLPDQGFDPTEVAVPWKTWRDLGHRIVFATPLGRVASADPRMVTGEGLGPLAGLLRADARGREAYAAVRQSIEFRHPIAWGDMGAVEVDALFLPGGHAPGMKPYLESMDVQAKVVSMFAAHRPVGAICHGVIVAARAKEASGRSVLHGRKTTALTRRMEMAAWWLTRWWLGDYYRTYPETVEDEVRRALASPEGPAPGATMRRILGGDSLFATACTSRRAGPETRTASRRNSPSSLRTPGARQRPRNRQRRRRAKMRLS
jgi:protease I